MKHKQYKFKTSAMKMRLIYTKQTLLVLVALVSAFTGCQQKEDPQPENSAVSTDALGTITSTTVILNGTLNKIGSGGVTDYGFVWGESENPDVSSTNKKSFGATSEVTTLKHTLTALTPGKTYHVRAYVTDAQGTFYGNNVTFNTLSPSIGGFSPESGAQKDTLTISGSNFTEVASDIIVKIGSVTVTTIVSSTANEIKVVIPSGVTEGANKVSVSIAGVEVTSSSDFNYFAGLWTEKKNFEGLAREAAISFTIGNKGYVGLGRTSLGSNDGLNDLWEYDSTTDTWAQKANYQGGKRSKAVVWINQGSVYVGLGLDETITGQKGFWQYAPGSNSWSKFLDYPSTSTIDGNEFAFVLGFNGYVISTKTKEVWQLSGINWTQKSNLPFTGSKNHFVLNDVVYVLATDKKLWKYDATNDNWSEVKSFPGTDFPNFSFALNNKGYAAEAVNHRPFEYKNTNLWEYNPSSDSWIQKNSLAKKSSDVYVYSEVMIINNKAYIREGGFRNKSFWEFDPTK